MTTFGELGFSNAAMPSLAEKGFTSVAISVATSSKHAMTAFSCEAVMKGSSPCTFITPSNSAPCLQ